MKIYWANILKRLRKEYGLTQGEIAEVLHTSRQTYNAIEKGRLNASITRKSLEDFYNSADEQTRMTLDLFLAPVFNNETMSEEEYLEMVASFYGEAAAKEVSESQVKINLISKDGSKQTLIYPLAQVFCGLF